MNIIEQRYFDWLCSKVMDSGNRHSKLMSALYCRMFIPIIDMDENRAEDGIGLRRRFTIENDQYSEREFDNSKPCSILEMMVALSIRCEESIMTNDEYGDRTGEWFWNMIVSLGLGPMNDERFDEDYLDIVITRFLNREYNPNGEGGLFTIDGIRKDMRNVEIWYQMCWYLDNLV